MTFNINFQHIIKSLPDHYGFRGEGTITFKPESIVLTGSLTRDYLTSFWVAFFVFMGIIVAIGCYGELYFLKIDPDNGAAAAENLQSMLALAFILLILPIFYWNYKIWEKYTAEMAEVEVPSDDLGKIRREGVRLFFNATRNDKRRAIGFAASSIDEAKQIQSMLKELLS